MRLKWILRMCALLALCVMRAPGQGEKPAGVPEGALQYGGHYYSVHDGAAMGWEKAAAACAKAGGYLAVINSPAERVFIETSLSLKPESRYWLGGRREANGKWFWSQSGKDSPLADSQIALVKRGAGALAVALRDAPHERDLAALDRSPSDLSVTGYICEWGDTQIFSATAAPLAGAESSTKAKSLKAGTVVLSTLLSPLKGDKDEDEDIDPDDYQRATLEAKAKAADVGNGLEISLSVKKVSSAQQNALNEVKALLRLAHGSRVDGKITIKVADAEKRHLDPGTALAWALMCDALIRGAELDPDVIIIGDVNADGRVQQDFSFSARLPALSELAGQRIGIAATDGVLLGDHLLRGEFHLCADNTVAALATMEEARAFAAKGSADPAVTDAFSMVQKLHQTKPENFAAFLANPKVLAKLDEVIAAQPTHLSAGLLRNYGRKTLGPRLSLTGSLHWIDELAEPLYKARSKEGFPDSAGHNPDPFVASVSGLRGARKKVDPRCYEAIDRLTEFGSELTRWVESRPSSSNGRKAAISTMIDTEKNYARAMSVLRTETLRERDK